MNPTINGGGQPFKSPVMHLPMSFVTTYERTCHRSELFKADNIAGLYFVRQMSRIGKGNIILQLNWLLDQMVACYNTKPNGSTVDDFTFEAYFEALTQYLSHREVYTQTMTKDLMELAGIVYYGFESMELQSDVVMLNWTSDDTGFFGIAANPLLLTESSLSEFI